MEPEKKIKNKSVVLAVILSVLMPGLGQIYTSQFSKGLIILGLGLVINFLLIEPLAKVEEVTAENVDGSLLFIVLAYLVAILVLLIYSILDAKRAAESINAQAQDS